jgi:GMP synthase (glutamine-hydrolysing)
VSATVPGAGAGRPVLALTHVPWETPGLVSGLLADVPWDVRTVVDDPAPDLPRAADLAGVVVMGGPQCADDDAAHPGLAPERRLLAEAVDAGVPVLGVCLGMQLLAVALGAALHRGHGTEIGFGPVDVVAAHPVLAALGPRPTVLHWHSDAVDLPSGGRLLASTPVTPVQAFSAGSALGLQFHLEVDTPLLRTWLGTAGMATELTAHDASELAGAGPDHLARLVPRATAGLGVFAAAVRARR